jgi:hypothetical protein
VSAFLWKELSYPSSPLLHRSHWGSGMLRNSSDTLFNSLGFDQGCQQHSLWPTLWWSCMISLPGPRTIAWSLLCSQDLLAASPAVSSPTPGST